MILHRIMHATKTDLILSADDADFADKKWKPLRQSVKSAAKGIAGQRLQRAAWRS